MRDVRRFINQKTGFDIVRFSGQHNLAAHLCKVISEYRIDTIVDVGANIGQFGSFLRDIGFRGHIISFEPVKAPFAVLKSVSHADKKWTAFNFALGAAVGESLINVSAATAFSSILQPSKFALTRWPGSHVNSQETIEVRTLDDCFAEGLIPDASLFLKMDTQGYDMEVFKGAQSVLPRIKGILSELSIVAVYEDMPNYRQSLAVFEASGFSVSGFYPITRNDDLSLNEVDCVLINTAMHKQ